MAILKNYPDTTTPLTVENLLDFCHPVGSYYDTSDTLFDPNVAWGGTWELDTDGVVYGSKSLTNGSPFNTNTGTIIGEDEHSLTVAEMPSHNHNLGLSSGGSSTGWGLNYTAASPTYRYYGGTDFIDNKGGGQAHNNIQRTRICNVWRRTA